MSFDQSAYTLLRNAIYSQQIKPFNNIYFAYKNNNLRENNLLTNHCSKWNCFRKINKSILYIIFHHILQFENHHRALFATDSLCVLLIGVFTPNLVCSTSLYTQKKRVNMCLDVYIFVRHTYASPIRLATPFRHPPFAPNSNATSKRFSSVHLVEFLSLQTMQASHTRLADIQTPIECTSPSQHIYIYMWWTYKHSHMCCSWCSICVLSRWAEQHRQSGTFLCLKHASYT